MLVGIGFLSTLTGTISSFFIHNSQPENHQTYCEKEVTAAIAMLNDFDHMTLDDLDKMHAVLHALKEKH